MTGEIRALARPMESGARWAVAGRVLTMADSGRPERVVVVEGDTIVDVGGPDLLARLEEDDGTTVVDVGDAVVLPGFVDPHAHVEATSRAHGETVDCRVPGCRSIEEVLQALSDNRSKARDGWLVGQANLFFDQKLEDKRLPTREELDSVSRDLSIVIRAGGHISVLNTRAFETSDVVSYAGKRGMAGGAVVERDSSGEPTGVIGELDKVLPLPEPTREELREELRTGMHELFTRYGVTSVGEISDSVDGLRLMDELISSGEAPLRTSVFLWAPGTLSVEAACDWERTLQFSAPREWLQVRGLKVFADGGYSARNAAARTEYMEPYAVEKGSRGQLDLSAEELGSLVGRANAAGLQLAVHANGERAQDAVCQGVVAAGPPEDERLRTRVEHAGNFVTTPDTVEWWRRAGIIPVPQPVFIYNFGDLFPVYLGEAGRRGRFPFRMLLEDGWRISGSSDIWIGGEQEQTNPFFSIWCCLRRQTFFGEIVDPDQALDIETALEMHTINAALTLGEADRRGSLEKGKVADLALVARDPRELEVDELRTLEVDATIAGGRLAHVRAEAG
jgi:predicted amidohydrolase YtcJ